jgi:hypothetical protein
MLADLAGLRGGRNAAAVWVISLAALGTSVVIKPAEVLSEVSLPLASCATQSQSSW